MGGHGADDASGTVVEVRDLRVLRGGREVLHGLDLTVSSGELLGLLGPSGGGKTTLMRAIVGAQARATGTVRVLGTTAGSPRLRGRIGYVTQAASVYDDLTARENLEFFAALLGRGGAEVDRVLHVVDLGAQAGQVVGSMSGGQRSRVSLATALIGRPPLLLLDEPTVGLDPVLRRDLWATFRRVADSGATIVVSSHVMDEADRCDRVALLRDGRLLATGAPDELRRRTGQTSMDEAFLALVEAGA